MTNQDPSLYCRICKYALSFGITPSGASYLVHATEEHGDTDDHAPDPIPLAQLPGAIQLCDFCGQPAAFVFAMVQEHISHHNRITKRWTKLQDYREHGPAAPIRRTETETVRTDLYGKRHAACAACTDLIEAVDKWAELHWMQPFDLAGSAWRYRDSATIGHGLGYAATAHVTGASMLR